MACNTIIDKDGNVVAIACSRGRRRRCSTANCDRPATKQCDYPLKNGGTCDRYICTPCATSMGRDLDYCPPHARHAARQQTLPLEGGR